MHTTAAPTLPVHQPLRKQVVGIDALRLLAAVLVMGSHLIVSSWLRSRNGGTMPTTAFLPWRPVFCYGWVGVEIFFVISGFVIAYSAQGVSAAKFARQRFFRLWPMCVLCATVALLATVWIYDWPWQRLLVLYGKTIVFWPDIPGTEFIDDPFWTLPVEVAFYLVVLLLIARGWLHRLPRVITVVGLVSTVYWCFVTADPFWSGRVWLLVHKSLQHLSFYPSSLVLHGCFFAVGVLLWNAMLRGPARPAHIAALVLCGAGCVQEIWYHASIAGPYLEMEMPRSGAVLIWLATVALIFASVRFNAALQHRLGTRGVSLLRAMGLITYPLYLLHNRLGFALILHLHPLLGWWGALGAAVVAVVATAAVFALFVDPAIQGRLKQRFGR